MEKLGFGFMRLPCRLGDQLVIDVETVKKMVDVFMERGFTYFDTAYVYHALRSEAAIKKALVDRYPRESYTLATKLPLISPFVRKEQDQPAVFERQLKKCGVDYFDYYLIHNLNSERYSLAQRLHTFEFVSGLKADGRAKNIGFSFHDKADLLDKILSEHPEVDFVQLQINYLDWDNEGVQSRKCYETALKHNKPVIVMEPVKGGMLAKMPEQAESILKTCNSNASLPSWAIRYAASLENVMVVLSGMSNLAQVEDNTSYMRDLKPLSDDERAALSQTVDLINQSIKVPCTGCGYCVAGCPKNIAIPNYFALYNSEMLVGSKTFSPHKEYYANYAKQHGKASDCINCGQCLHACPQHIDVPACLKDVAKTME